MNSNYICTIILGFRFKSYFHNTKISILISEVKLVSLMIDYSNCLQPCIPKIMNFSYYHHINGSCETNSNGHA